MNEILSKKEVKCEDASLQAPAAIDNAVEDKQTHEKTEPIDSKKIKGQAEKTAPSENLILGKFKSVEDLSKAYEELQKLQGKSSQELGTLRKELTDFGNLKEVSEKISSYQNSIIPVIQRDRDMYNSPEYFQNENFKEIFGCVIFR